jgi:hypothetical protein
MPPLADLQRQMAGAILSGEHSDMPALAPSPIPAEAAFAVHRNTVLGGLANALRLTFPTVDALVGEAFFDQMASAFVVQQPPRRANLSAYGEGFAAFIEDYPHAASLAYLGDVARLDLAVAQALVKPDLDLRRQFDLDAAVRLSLPVSLTVLALNSPTDLIRSGVEADDDEALAAIDLTTAPRWFAVWRAGRAAAVQTLSPPAGQFLAAILTGFSAEDALDAATNDAGPIVALRAIQTEVFTARFAQIIQTRPKDPQP